MRKVKKLFKLYTEGVSKRQISIQLGLSRNTVAKYIAFFQLYKLTNYEVSAMTLEELHRLFYLWTKKEELPAKNLRAVFPIF